MLGADHRDLAKPTMMHPEPGPGPGDITLLLREASHGNREAFDRLLPLIYGELRHLARHRLVLERREHTLGTTALVHEAYLKLVDQTRTEWHGRQQFFAIASEAMRRILIDYAKRRNAGKRGGGLAVLPLDEVGELADDGGFLSADDADRLIALDAALERLTGFNPQGARIVQYRFFGGLSMEEVAVLLGVSERTVRRGWTVAKAWLQRELGDFLSPDGLTLGGGAAAG
jgi:RNA polymerase sigma factor (TIGR02999 family)